MTLFQRFRRQVLADTHGVMDSLEDRTLLLKQQLREAEAALIQKERGLKQLVEEQTQISRSIEQLKAREAGLEADVSLAVSSGNDDLARPSLKRLLGLRRHLLQKQQQLAAVQQEQQALSEQLGQQRTTFEELELRVQARLQRGLPENDEELRVTDEQIELELLRRKQNLVADNEGRAVDEPHEPREPNPSQAGEAK